MNKQSIAIDMDEVIADTIDKFIELYKREHNIEIRLDEMDGKEFNEMLPEEIKQTLKQYIHQPGFFRDLKVMPGSQEVIKELCEKYDVYIVSAAMENVSRPRLFAFFQHHCHRNGRVVFRSLILDRC